MLSPATTEDLSALLREGYAEGRTVMPTGAGTKLSWGNAITADDVVSTANLNGVRQHSWGDLTATVAAGTPWSVMQKALAVHNQRVALDPLFPQQATVGGILATNDSGLLRMRYGGLRDLVLGMTIVLADGTIARTGGKVVKNVAGYDLPKLLTGSFGTLGIIAEATFRLHPVPAYTSTFTARSADISCIAALMQQLVLSGLGLEAMQLRNEPATSAGQSRFALDIQFAAVPEALAEHERRLRALATRQIELEPHTQKMDSARASLFSIPRATVLKLTTLPTKLSALISGFAQLEAHGMTAQAVADPTGIVTVALVAPPEGLATILEDLRARLAPIGGTVVVLQRGKLPGNIDPWNAPAHPPPALDVMRAIKQQFDPQRLLNPGKFVSGL